MRVRHPSFRLILTGLLALACSGSSVDAELLGEISFPNSGTEVAQDDFIEGVLYLHNFEYEAARDAFRRAQALDPDFAMAYWGEAMTHNHPIWMERDSAAGRAALEKLAGSPSERQARAGSEREAAYLAAVDILYGLAPESAQLDKEDQDDLYLEAMRRLANAFPEDHEATSFHALAILGSAHEGRDFATYMRAAAVAGEVWAENDNHPGAAHYLIHSFDDPIHAPLGLPMARTYAKIAPAAAHAQHMTSHIFVAMGMWQDVIDANVVARDVQNAGFAARGRAPRLCGHYPYWLEYGYLQQGRVDKATAVLESCRDSLSATSDPGVRWHYSAMRARHLIDLEQWDAADDWPEVLARDASGHHNYVFARALAAYRRGDFETIGQAIQTLRRVGAGSGPRESDFGKVAAILATELEGLLLVPTDVEAAVAKLREATAMEAELPYSFGPPTIVKPAWELLGEVLLAHDRSEEAVKVFREQLSRTPGRALSLLGLARSAHASNRWQLARDTYGELASVWANASVEMGQVSEARAGAASR